MSLVNGKADDGTALVVPVTALYNAEAKRIEAEGRAADAERRAERAEAALRDLRERLIRESPDSPLGRRAQLQLELAALPGRAPRT